MTNTVEKKTKPSGKSININELNSLKYGDFQNKI